jgi:hypothetical protein
MDETGEQVEFTPNELKWWTFKFIMRHPILSFRWFWEGLGNDF